MFLLYAVSFIFSLGYIYGVGHLFAGAPQKALAYFVAGGLWFVLNALLGLSTGGSALCCFLPLHLLFAHFCASDAVRVARGQS